ncbi:delta(14)-sterol reductase isoform X1 [Mycetomoellerius zeteki]|uniref:delta(14)-sterol reductase isoform X1 n=1 Tax=Mycetomoellerius zeteki TaxID=64791 RepID=UPI00084EA26B|nr:PREDICTED: delta(14)-sterol reductase isoform X1 [Trachymyrmex zeteki]XP_018306416.1 PREDICTED: delta(14)-sterol reductase isoform X1 [Trachymyrmex zeteki]XP_018306417.1 PREDICTED: delta(14)-sterol reductase isoform X1 [Trachymyrmex zeteki]
MKFSEGEEVLAKHPNTSEYYKGRILNVRGDRYKIHFETGIEHTVRENDIKAERLGRTSTRTSRRTKSPTRHSPSRKSPSRRSPGRQSGRSPARSPSFTSRKLPIRSTRLAKISLSRIDVEGNKTSNHKGSDVKSPDESPTDSLPLQQRLREAMTITHRPSLLKTEQEYKSIIMRSIDRAASLPVERKSYVQDYPLGEKERGYSMQRDQDITKPLYESEKWETVVKREKEINRVDKPQEWGGWIGTFFLTFILPMSVILPQLLCSEGQCKYALIKFSADVKSYINLYTLLSYIAFLTLLACISIIPIGKIIEGQQSKIGRLQYRINGFLSAIVAIIGLGLCVYMNIPVSEYILNNIVQLSVSGWIVGTILALGLYIKAGKAPVINLNLYASTNSKIYNFWQGREINPRFGTLDIKLLLIRASLIGTLIVNIAIALKAVGNIKSPNIEKLDVATLLAVLLQLFYIVHGLIYEATIFTSFTIMYEGTGYMTCVSHLLYPFLTTLTARFILYQKIKLNYFVGLSILSFMMGYALYKCSNLRKDEFRKNPISPTVPYLETIPTSRGKKLMLSGLWGHVRHPNYLGDIIIQWSIASIGLANDILPYYTAICCTLVLAYRAVRDNKRCQMRYGYAWEQYCSRVKYMILKRIF